MANRPEAVNPGRFVPVAAIRSIASGRRPGSPHIGTGSDVISPTFAHDCDVPRFRHNRGQGSQNRRGPHTRERGAPAYRSPAFWFFRLRRPPRILPVPRSLHNPEPVIQILECRVDLSDDLVAGFGLPVTQLEAHA